ncbi:hypothetical protein BCR44DRAFT_1463901 [Catenaria anguillulae PL171]|uniref:Uncharacterized protein n=1 Tax=Catenaria anguillulae PL171 TaxID=765915 RepID=A0A1Y2H9W8_9FUNG|nr:hypothetical protein BCR44DRAFT_1463901 [Catenaria anguillulae PL171]
MCALTNTPRCGPIGARFFITWFFLLVVICVLFNIPLALSAPLPASPNVTFTGTPRSLTLPRLDLFPAQLTTIFQVGLNNINPSKTRPVSTILSSPLPASIDFLSAWPGAITQLMTRNASFVPHAPIASLHFSSVGGTDLGRRVHTAFTSATETATKPVLSLLSLVPTVFALIVGALRDSVRLIQIHDHEHELKFLAERVYRTCPLSAVASHLGRNATSVNGDAGVLNHDDVPTNVDRLYMHATRDSSSYTSYSPYSNSSNKDRQSYAKSHGNTSRTSLNLLGSTTRSQGNFSALEFNHTMCLHRDTPLTLQENKLPAQSSVAPVQSTHPDRRQEEAADGSMFKLVVRWQGGIFSGKVGEAKEAKSGKGKRKKNQARTAKAGVKEAMETFQAPPIANPQHISWADFAYFDELEDAANASSDAPFAYNDDGHRLSPIHRANTPSALVYRHACPTRPSIWAVPSWHIAFPVPPVVRKPVAVARRVPQ